MTGRGIDQILPRPCDPAIHERCVDDALGYVRLAEQVSGAIPRPVEASYVWGDALEELARARPQARIVNLETAVTRSEAWMPKGINYRMNPANVACLTAAAIDCCTLANNHVLDWGERGLADTLDTLHGAGVATAGAGRDRAEAEAPAILALGADRRILVFSVGSENSGIPAQWAATHRKPGVAFLEGFSARTAAAFAARVQRFKRSGDLVVASIHWGANWDYDISSAEVQFAHALIDRAGVDILHGHSSHHLKAIEVYGGKLILYGCGDFINDYEGIGGHEQFRGELGMMYFPTLDGGSGRLLRLELVPTRMRRFQVRRANVADSGWLRNLIDREGLRFGTSAEPGAAGRFELRWPGSG